MSCFSERAALEFITVTFIFSFTHSLLVKQVLFISFLRSNNLYFLVRQLDVVYY